MGSLVAPKDLAELDAVTAAQEEGIEVPILHMDGKTPLGFSIRVAGPDSARADAAHERQRQELLARASTEPLTREELLAQGSRFLARISIAFVGRAILDSQVLEDREDDFFRLYQRFRFIRAQVDAEGSRRDRFLSVLQKSSSEQPEKR
jgi:hypothetical protein